MPIIVENVVATASNMHTGTIFWSDMKLKKISRLDRGSEPQEVSILDASYGCFWQGLFLALSHFIKHTLRRKDSDTYLTTVSRHRWSRQIMMKIDKIS